MNPHMFDNLLGALLIVGALAGIAIGGIVFWLIPLIWSHFSIVIH